MSNRAAQALALRCVDVSRLTGCAWTFECFTGLLVETALVDAIKDPVERARLVKLLGSRA